MKKTLLAFFIFFTLQNILFAHSVVLQLVDNEDGTMEIFGGFNTGQSAAGAKLIIKSKLDSKILYENRVPKSGILTLKIPNEPYRVILDSGPGHKIEKNGYIKPINGFKKTISKGSYNYAFTTTLGLSIGFILLSIILTIYRKKTCKNY